MKITALKQQVKRPERISVFIDGTYSFSLSMDELVRERLAVKQEIDAPRLKQLQKASEDGKVRMRTLAWVAMRPHSTYECQEYLRRKKVDPSLAEQLIGEFSRLGYLNDEAFAEWLVRLRRTQGKSDVAVRADLSRKGIRGSLAASALEATSEESTEAERLQRLIEKKIRLSRYRADPNKLVQYLVRQGFQYSAVRSALNAHHTE